MLRDSGISAATHELDKTKRRVKQLKVQKKQAKQRKKYIEENIEYFNDKERFNKIIKKRLNLKNQAEYNPYALEDKMIQDIIETDIRMIQKQRENQGDLSF